MEEQFVTYEIALKLKELGFDEPCFGYYDEESFYKEVIACSEFDLNYAGGRNVFHENFHAITNSELDEFGSFSMKYDTEDAYDRWGAPLWQQVQSFLDDNGVIIGIIFVDNVFKYTLNTNNYVSNGFKDRMSAIKSATEHATNYLWNKKFNK